MEPDGSPKFRTLYDWDFNQPLEMTMDLPDGCTAGAGRGCRRAIMEEPVHETGSILVFYRQQRQPRPR